jgi:hypothetical protein
MAVSGPVLLRVSMRLFADQTKANKDDPPGAAWPDFARYDCRACHHELKVDAVAQNRTGPAAAGRPGDAKWIHVLTRLGISVMTPAENVAKEIAKCESGVSKFQKAMISEPFGNKERAIEAAEELVRWADALIKKNPKAPVDQTRAQALLAQLCAETEKASFDYDSARQFAWALRVIFDDLARDDPKKPKDPAIERILAKIEKSLLTTFPSAKVQTPIVESLPSRFEAESRFDRSAIAKLFSELKRHVMKN